MLASSLHQPSHPNPPDWPIPSLCASDIGLLGQSPYHASAPYLTNLSSSFAMGLCANDLPDLSKHFLVCKVGIAVLAYVAYGTVIAYLECCTYWTWWPLLMLHPTFDITLFYHGTKETFLKWILQFWKVVNSVLPPLLCLPSSAQDNSSTNLWNERSSGFSYWIF